MLNTAACIYFLNPSLGGIKNWKTNKNVITTPKHKMVFFLNKRQKDWRKTYFLSWEINEIV